METAVQSEFSSYLTDPTLRGRTADALFSRLACGDQVGRVGNSWVLSGFDLIKRAASSKSLSMERLTFPATAVQANPGFVDFFANNLFLRPTADHRRLRSVLSAHFTPAAVNALREPTSRMTRELIGAAARTHGPEFDFVTGVANTLPSWVASELIGVPQADRGWISNQAVGLLARLLASFPGTGTLPGEPITVEDFDQLSRYFADRLAGVNDAGTLLARLQDAVGSAVIDRAEAVDLLLLLFMAGVDTVITGLTNAVSLTLDQPGGFDAIADGSLSAAAAFDESLRLFTPVPFALRRAESDWPVGDGQVVRAGDGVFLCYGAANRDPLHFTEPARWLPGRTGGSMSFGHGLYHCIGAALGGVEGEAVLSALAEARVHHASARPTKWNDNIGFHSPAELYIAVG